MYNNHRGNDRGGYKGARGGFGGGRDSRGGGFEKRMFPAVCAKCGDNCEVPFKPNGRKPVHCSNCFNKEDHFAGKSFDRPERSSFGDRAPRAPDSGVADQLKTINDKLDAIIDALND